jgi:hypothetical protein
LALPENIKPVDKQDSRTAGSYSFCLVELEVSKWHASNFIDGFSEKVQIKDRSYMHASNFIDEFPISHQMIRIRNCK